MPQSKSVILFINTLLTEDEQVTLGRRLLICQMILKGKTQAEIRYELGVSPNTFTRTRKWLTREIPEYQNALMAHKKKVSEKRNSLTKRKREFAAPLTFSNLKKRYPMHFLLFNIADEILKR